MKIEFGIFLFRKLVYLSNELRRFKFKNYCLSVLKDESNMEYMNDEMITGFKEIIHRRLARSTRNYVNYAGMDCPSNDIGDEDYVEK